MLTCPRCEIACDSGLMVRCSDGRIACPKCVRNYRLHIVEADVNVPALMEDVRRYRDSVMSVYGRRRPQAPSWGERLTLYVVVPILASALTVLVIRWLCG